MRIAIAEDEDQIRHYVSEAFKKEAYEVEEVSSFEELQFILDRQKEEEIQFWVLDRLLGEKDTSSLIKKIKTKSPETPILILSAIGGAQEKSKILDLGADDYLSKPFSIEELLSRVRALNRRRIRAEDSNQNYKKLGNTVLIQEYQSFEVEGKKVDFSRKEFLVCKLLFDHPKRVYSKYQILDHVWDVHAEIESNVVEVAIKNIRKKLDDSQSNLKVMSQRNVGYWIEV